MTRWISEYKKIFFKRHQHTITHTNNCSYPQHQTSPTTTVNVTTQKSLPENVTLSQVENGGIATQTSFTNHLRALTRNVHASTSDLSFHNSQCRDKSGHTKSGVIHVPLNHQQDHSIGHSNSRLHDKKFVTNTGSNTDSMVPKIVENSVQVNAPNYVTSNSSCNSYPNLGTPSIIYTKDSETQYNDPEKLIFLVSSNCSFDGSESHHYHPPPQIGRMSVVEENKIRDIQSSYSHDPQKSAHTMSNSHISHFKSLQSKPRKSIMTDKMRDNFNKFDNYSQQRKSLLHSNSYRNVLSNFLSSRQDKVNYSNMSFQGHLTNSSPSVYLPIAHQSYSSIKFSSSQEESCYIAGMLEGYKLSQQSFKSSSSLHDQYENDRKAASSTDVSNKRIESYHKKISSTSFPPSLNDISLPLSFPSEVSSDFSIQSLGRIILPQNSDTSFSNTQEKDCYVAGLVKGYSRGQQLGSIMTENEAEQGAVVESQHGNSLESIQQQHTDDKHANRSTVGIVNDMATRFENGYQQIQQDMYKTKIESRCVPKKLGKEPLKHSLNYQKLCAMTEYEKLRSMSIVDEVKTRIETSIATEVNNCDPKKPKEHFNEFTYKPEQPRISENVNQMPDKLTFHVSECNQDKSVKAEERGPKSEIPSSTLISENSGSTVSDTESKTSKISQINDNKPDETHYNQNKIDFKDYNDHRQSLVQSKSFRNVLHGLLSKPAPLRESKIFRNTGPHPVLLENSVFRNNLNSVIQNKLARCNVKRTKNSLEHIPALDRREMLSAFYDKDFRKLLEDMMYRVFDRHYSEKFESNTYSEISVLTSDLKSILESLRSSLPNSLESIQQVQNKSSNETNLTHDRISKIIEILSDSESMYVETPASMYTSESTIPTKSSTTTSTSSVESNNNYPITLPQLSQDSRFTEDNTSLTTTESLSDTTQTSQYSKSTDLPDSPRHRDQVLENVEPGQISQLQTSHNNLVTFSILCLTCHGISIEPCWLYWKIAAITALSSVERDGRLTVGDVIFEVNDTSTRGLPKEGVRKLLSTLSNDKILKITVLRKKNTSEDRKRLLTKRSIARFSSRSEFIKQDEIRYSTRFRELSDELDIFN